MTGLRVINSSCTSNIPNDGGGGVDVAESSYSCFQCVSPSPGTRSCSSPCLWPQNCWSQYWLQLPEFTQILLLIQINFSEQKFFKKLSSQTSKNEDAENTFRMLFGSIHFFFWIAMNAKYRPPISHLHKPKSKSALYAVWMCDLYTLCRQFRKDKLHKKTVNVEIIPWLTKGSSHDQIPYTERTKCSWLLS